MKPGGDIDTYPGNTLTGSDIVKGGEQPVLLASDALGRIGLLRYPAELPETPSIPAIEPAPGKKRGGTIGGGETGWFERVYYSICYRIAPYRRSLSLR